MPRFRWPHKELERWKIRPVRNTFELGGLSGSVLVHEGARVGYARVKFDESFVTDLGKHMPFGVSYDFPAYLLLERRKGQWRFTGCYFKRPDKVTLWTTNVLPAWVKVRWGRKDAKTNTKEAR